MTRAASRQTARRRFTISLPGCAGLTLRERVLRAFLFSLRYWRPIAAAGPIRPESRGRAKGRDIGRGTYLPDAERARSESLAGGFSPHHASSAAGAAPSPPTSNTFVCSPSLGSRNARDRKSPDIFQKPGNRAAQALFAEGFRHIALSTHVPPQPHVQFMVYCSEHNHRDCLRSR